MAFPYMNEHSSASSLHGTITASAEYNLQESTHEAEYTEAHGWVTATIASSTADHWTQTIEDQGATGTGSSAMATAGGVSVALTALTTYDFTFTEGTVNAGDAVGVNNVEAGTASLTLPTIDLKWINGLPAGVGLAA